MNNNKICIVLTLCLVIPVCFAQSEHKVSTQDSRCQRFVPIESTAQVVQGVPWHGYFALDTQTGQLCRTTTHEFSGDGSKFNELPICMSLK
jgi:hypothetical protein